MVKSLKYNSEPLVTIGIPTYNRPIELRKALETSINQSYKKVIERRKGRISRIYFYEINSWTRKSRRTV